MPARRSSLKQAAPGPGAVTDPDVDMLRRVVALAFAVTLALSPRLWLTEREFPLTPVWRGLPQPPYPLDHVLLAVGLLALLGAVVLPSPRWCLRVACGLGWVSLPLDQSRWQPFVIQYLVLLSCLLLVPWERRKEWRAVDFHALLTPARLFLAFTYCYSGVQKLNYVFAVNVFPWMLQPLLERLGVAAHPPRILTGLALSAALAEAVAGGCLLVPQTRRTAVLFLVAMHGLILLLIGPGGHNYNRIVWPWNVAGMLALPCLFWRHRKGATAGEVGRGRIRRKLAKEMPAETMQPRTRRWVTLQTALVCVLFGLLPLLSFVDRWDSYLAFSLYAGNTREAMFHVDPADQERLPPHARAAMVGTDGTFDPFHWSLSDLGVTSYPEDRIVLNAAHALARHVTQGPVHIQLFGKPHLLTGERRIRELVIPPGDGPAREVAPRTP